MAGRPPNPVLVSGRAFVWIDPPVDGVAHRSEAQRKAAEVLFNGHLALEVRGQYHSLFGFVFGQSAEGEVPIYRLEHLSIGPPSFQTYAVVAEGRLPGIPVQLALLSETARNRRWLATFGFLDRGVDFWLRTLGLPQPLSVSSGAAVFTTREKRDKVRKSLWELQKGSRPC